MDWLVLSLTAAVLWGGVSVVDKVILEKYIPNPLLYAFFMGAYGLISALVVSWIVPIQIWPIGATLLACLSGALYLLYILLYFAALGRNDTAIVVALGQITPIFATLWDYLILGEVFGVTTYLGVIIVVLGTLFISLEYSHDSVKTSIRLNSAALQLMIAACFVRSLSDLMLKYALTELTSWDGFFWPRWGIFAGTLVILVFHPGRQQWSVAIKTIGLRVNLLILVSEIIALGGTLAITLAYDRGPLTLVSASSSIQPLFILLFIWAVNLIKQGTIPERATLKQCIPRLLPLLVIIFGAYLLGER